MDHCQMAIASTIKMETGLITDLRILSVRHGTSTADSIIRESPVSSAGRRSELTKDIPVPVVATDGPDRCPPHHWILGPPRYDELANVEYTDQLCKHCGAKRTCAFEIPFKENSNEDATRRRLRFEND